VTTGEPWIYQAADDSVREKARAAASRALAPDWYGRAIEVADAVSEVWEAEVMSGGR